MNSSIGWPNGITIDYRRGKIYWADAKLDKIEVMNLNGKNRKVIVDTDVPHVFGLTILHNRLYWTDWQKRSIESVNKRNGRGRRVIRKGVTSLMGLKAVDLHFRYGKGVLCCYCCCCLFLLSKCEPLNKIEVKTDVYVHAQSLTFTWRRKLYLSLLHQSL